MDNIIYIYIYIMGRPARLGEPCSSGSAVAAERSTGVPAGFIVGQAALETGWGRQEIRHADGRSAHNLFGIKAGAGWRGGTVDATTTEYVDGRAVKTVERFRAYASHEEAFADWAKLMASNPRYAGVLQAGGSIEAFSRNLQKAGYATDPDYASKLTRTITQALTLRRAST
jgi:flagellar protein FlgJ